jgi:hypothetical protein
MAISGGNTYTGGLGGSGGGLDPRIPEIWSGMIQEEMFAKAVATNFFTDLSREFDNGGDIVNISDFYTNTFTVDPQSTAGTEVTLRNPALNNVTLTVNRDRYIAFFRSNAQMAQLLKREDLQAAFIRKAGKSLIDNVEDCIFALWSGLTGNTAVGDTDTVLTDLELRQAMRTLDVRNFDLFGGDVAWFIHPRVYWDQIAGLAKIYDASSYGDASVVKTGTFAAANPSVGNRGRLYGVPLYVSTNVVSGLQTYRNMLAHRDAFGFAFQKVTGSGSPVAVNVSYENRNLGWLTTLEILYGCSELRDQAAVLVNANSTATTS